MKIKEFAIGTTGTTEAVILKVEEKNTKTNTIYLDLTISDGETQATVKKWNESAESFKFKEGQVAFIELKAEKYNETVSFIVKNITESSADARQFVISAPVDSEAMFAFLMKTAQKCGVYAPVVKNILNDNKEKLLYWSAGKKVHHNIAGGLLYHTYRMTKTAAYLASVYNKENSMLPGCRDVSTELLVAGTILHDIGKLWELETSPLGDSEYTVQGTLMGHLFIGAEVVGRYARKLKMDAESTMLLQHLILAHHGKHEYNTVVIPAIPEAMILHNLDMIDSRMYQFEAEADKIEPGVMSGMVFGLDQKVYRPSWRVPIEPAKTEE